jgi:hypothetical protein
MPHYKDGTEAQVGDVVIGKDYEGKTVVGHVNHIYPGSTTCNMQISTIVQAPQVVIRTETIGNFGLLHRDGLEHEHTSEPAAT